MIKVMYLYESLKVGGAEQLLLTTLKYLDRNKFLPVVYCIADKGGIGLEIEAQTGIIVNSLNKHCRLWSVGTLFDLVHILIKEKPRILHTHLFYANYFGRIASIFAKINSVIITEHGTHSNFKKFYHHLIDFILSFFTYRVIAVSKAVEKYLCKYTHILPGKITVIHNAVDFDRFEKVKESDKYSLRKQFGFSDSDFIIACVSNLAYWKGQFFLLQAFAEIKNSLPSLKLLFVGRDTEGFQNQLVAFCRQNGLCESVYFLGERRDIPEILRASDIFVFPSITEGLGISLLEAMYMGLPAIASNTEGILEVIEDDKDGILMPAADPRSLASKIGMLLGDDNKIKILGNNARDKVKKYFSPEGYIQQLESVYEELIKR